MGADSPVDTVDQLLGKVITVLEQQADVVVALGDCSRRVRQAAIERDAVALRLATSQSEALLGKQQALERQRQEYLSALGAQLGVPRARLVASDLMLHEGISWERRRDLQRVVSTLREAVLALSDLNGQNRRLLHSLLRATSESLAFLRALLARGGEYDAEGRLSPVEAGSRVLDCRV